MNDARETRASEFVLLAGECLRRYLAQSGRTPLPEPMLAAVCRGIWDTAVREGLPRTLKPGDLGEPREMPVVEVNRLMAEAFRGVEWPPLPSGSGETSRWSGDLANPVRQLLKACLQPDFRKCRESYHEVISGKCRRQELGRVRERVSGSHCVDCPYWDEFADGGPHRAFLRPQWVGDPGELDREIAVFLPEDYRRLRQFLRRIRNNVQACETRTSDTDTGSGNAT